MEVKRFFSTTMQDALRLVREEFGSDAVILSNARTEGGVEIVAALGYEDDWDEQAVEQEITNHGEPSPSQLARMHAEKHLQLQREMEQAKRKIEAARASKAKQHGNRGRRDEKAMPQDDGVSAVNPKVVSVNSVSAKNSFGEQGMEQSWEALSAMRAEILEIKDLIARSPEKQTQALQAAQKTLLEQQLEKKMDSLCLSRSVKQSLLQEAGRWLQQTQRSASAQEDNFDVLWQHLSRFIEKSICLDGTEIIDRQGIFALVGPTGSGKTMTIGKMAARYVMEYGAEHIALVTTDRYRIAAHEQLKVFGRILNIPVHSVDEVHSLDMILDKLSQKKIVLIDTAGLMHTDRCWSEQLQEIKLSRHRIECYLTVAAVGQYQVMSSNYHHYRMLDLAGVIVTKVDEAVSLGEVLSFLIDTGLNASYYTDGQRVPEDIHLFDAHALFDRAQTLLNSSERWVTIRAEDHAAQSVLSRAATGIRDSVRYHSA
jgi:flagellar biosynthesis protein FlhF